MVSVVFMYTGRIEGATRKKGQLAAVANAIGKMCETIQASFAE